MGFARPGIPFTMAVLKLYRDHTTPDEIWLAVGTSSRVLSHKRILKQDRRSVDRIGKT